MLGIERDAQPAERRERIRHQALAAGLVDGRQRGIRHGHAKAAGAQRDGGGQSSRPSAHYKDVGLFGDFVIEINI